MYRLITCDLDETLLDKERHVSKRNLEWIKKAEEAGAFFVPATGRGFHSIRKTLEELDAVDKQDHYMIGLNGGVIVANQGGTIIEDNPIDFDLLSTLFQFGLNYEVTIHLYTFDQAYIYQINPEEAAYLSTIPHQVVETNEIDFLNDEVCYKVLFQNLDRRYLETIEAELPRELRAQVEISYSSNRYLEFNPAGVTKGEALLSLAKRLGIAPQETIAIGDNTNDRTMIETAELGVAVQNAIPEIKAIAQYVTDADHNQSAVAEVIQKFVL
ncbi:haloacid dehalogenase [Enterococcus florum]|uniref:Haloacid dehalogenase n=1 Tax=Enterococcus florum TaxID=2480627 RepID=A0A4P5P8G0_9ENTE|nr:Cof-type HAD-IIB family hydrolase [Enterococcus florum]GCF93816.1 haloacid dehalogenase [Enterococcus florum]